MIATTANFGGSIPEYYDSCLGPAWFDTFGEELARRLPASGTGDVLEIAAGTGLVTARLRAAIDPRHRLVASDISAGMLDYAKAKLAATPGIDWRLADACSLPFADGGFGAVVCAFGLMFVPDKKAALKEVHRVLRPGGTLLFDVWDRMEEVPAAAINARVITQLFPGVPDVVLTTPYELHDPDLLRALLDDAGFTDVSIEPRCLPVDRVSARTIALGQIRGSPRGLLLEKHGIPLDEVVDTVAAALADEGGADPWRGTASALFIQARKG